MLRYLTASVVIATILSLPILLVSTHALETPEQSSVSDSSCTALDVVFLIDQSQSMENNDSKGLRDDAVKTAIEILGDNALFHCPGVQHRIAVIGFGEDTSVDDYRADINVYIESGSIAPKRDTPADIQAWRDDRLALQELVLEDDDLGATDHISAFMAARDTFSSWDHEPLGDFDRKKAVLLVTDGGPCTGYACETHTMQYGPYMDELLELTDPAASSFLWRGQDNPQSVCIWMILLNDSTSDEYNYMRNRVIIDAWTEIAEGHGGGIRRLETDKGNLELTTQIYESLAPLLGSELKPWPCQQPIWIDPYTNDVTIFHIWKQGTDGKTKLEDVKAQILVNPGTDDEIKIEDGRITGPDILKVDDYSKGDFNEHYVFYQPVPGKYMIEVIGADICVDLDIRVGEETIEAELTSPASEHIFAESVSEPHYDMSDPQRFEFQLSQVNAEGTLEPLVEDSGYPLNLSVAVTAQQTGDAWDYEFELDTSETGLYKSVDFIKTPIDGTYTWELTVTTTNPRQNEPAGSPDYDDTPLEVLKQSGTFRVVPIELFHFRVIEPLSDEDRALNQVLAQGQVPEPVKVSVELLNEAGEVLPAQDVFDDPNEAFEVKVLDESGAVLQTLTLDSEGNSSGRFSALARSNPEGEIDAPGKLTFRVSPVPANYKRLEFAPDPDGLEESVTINRYEILPLDLLITPPDSPTLYRENAQGAQELNPFKLTFQIQDTKNERAIEPEQALASAPAEIIATVYAPNGESETFAAQRLPGKDTYQGEAGLELDQPGRYKVEVDLDALTLNQGFAWMTDKSTMSLNRVRLFSFQIVEPKPGGEYPLNRVEDEDLVPESLKIVVELLDAGGQKLSPDQVFTDTQKAFQVTVLDESGSVLETINLVPDASQPGYLSGVVRDNPPDKIDPPGELVMRIESVESCQQPSFAPATPQATVTFNRYEVHRLDLVITMENSTVHRSGMASVKGELNPFEFTLEIKDFASGEAIDPEKVLAAGYSSIKVTVSAPNGDSRTAEATMQSAQGGSIYQGKVDSKFNQSGTFTIKADLGTLQLKKEFAWVKSEHERTATSNRQDTWQTNPTIIRAIAGVSGVILVLIAILIFYWLTGGPRGSLYVTESFSPDNIEAGPWRLRSVPRVNVLRKSYLNKMGIKRIKVRRAKPLDPDTKRAVQVTFVYKESTPDYPVLLDVDQATPINDEFDILYK